MAGLRRVKAVLRGVEARFRGVDAGSRRTGQGGVNRDQDRVERGPGASNDKAQRGKPIAMALCGRKDAA
eukprot:319857-Chlamydomonas_euryale.AAC.5